MNTRAREIVSGGMRTIALALLYALAACSAPTDDDATGEGGDSDRDVLVCMGYGESWDWGEQAVKVGLECGDVSDLPLGPDLSTWIAQCSEDGTCQDLDDGCPQDPYGTRAMCSTLRECSRTASAVTLDERVEATLDEIEAAVCTTKPT